MIWWFVVLFLLVSWQMRVKARRGYGWEDRRWWWDFEVRDDTKNSDDRTD